MIILKVLKMPRVHSLGLIDALVALFFLLFFLSRGPTFLVRLSLYKLWQTRLFFCLLHERVLTDIKRPSKRKGQQQCFVCLVRGVLSLEMHHHDLADF
jgi:hypothetical protein